MSTRLLSLIAGLSLLAVQQKPLAAGGDDDSASFTAVFPMEPEELCSTGRNPYFVLEPGWILEMADGDNRVIITVLSEPKKVDGVETRIVEERETEGGRLKEVSRNYFAISKRTNSVFYFGEDVDIYENDKVVNHEGAWHAGVDGAKFGLMMPGLVLLKGRHYQEIAPDVAMDRAEILSMTETVVTPSGEYKNCVKVEETTPIEPGSREHKYYAAGVGIVQDGKLKLVRFGAERKH